MNPILIGVFGLSLFLIAIDRFVKRRRLSQREEMGDESFLEYFKDSVTPERFSDVLAVRSIVAQQLGLPARKIRPTDSLVELRDELCLVVSGHMALGELLEDLESEIEPRSLENEIETVEQYIEEYISDSS